jgi:FkbM family methyltransferase
MKPIAILKHSVTIKQFLYRVIYLNPFRARSPINQAIKRAVDRGGAVCFYIGANDGLSGNHVNEFVVSGRLRCVFVEPVPFVFERLSRVYGGRENVQLVNCAVGGSDGHAMFHYLKGGTRPGYDQVGSFNREQVEEKIPDYGGTVVSLELKTITFQTLMGLARFNDVRILVVDAEGYDAEIVVQALTAIHPEVIVYEHMYLPEATQAELKARLTQEGYVLETLHGDTLAIRDEKSAAKA